MARSPVRAARCVALLWMVAPLAASAHAQGALTAFVALKGAAQGQFKGDATIPAYKNEIAAMSLSTSQPYGAATPLVHVVTSVGVAPQIVHALLTNEMLQTPSISFAKQGPTGTVQQIYQIKALRGYVTSATISADDVHTPTLTFDLLLSGGTTYANETGAATTAPPPAFTGSVPNAPGVVLTGEFKGMRTGDFASSPNAPMHRGILLNSASVSVSVPVLNGATGGKAVAHPLVITRPTSEDATLFDDARATQETFSKILLHVYETQPNGSLADVFDIETQDACFDVGTAACAPASGMATGQPGASAGLSSSGARATAPRSTTGMRRVNDASTTMQFLIPMLTIQNHQTQALVSYSFVQAKLD